MQVHMLNLNLNDLIEGFQRVPNILFLEVFQYLQVCAFEFYLKSEPSQSLRVHGKHCHQIAACTC